MEAALCIWVRLWRRAAGSSIIPVLSFTGGTVTDGPETAGPEGTINAGAIKDLLC